MKVAGEVLDSIVKLSKLLGLGVDRDDFAFEASSDKLTVLAGNYAHTAIIKAEWAIVGGPVEPKMVAQSTKRFAEGATVFAKDKEVDVVFEGQFLVLSTPRKKRRIASVDERNAETPKLPTSIPWTTNVTLDRAWLVEVAKATSDFHLARFTIDAGVFTWACKNETDEHSESHPVAVDQPKTSSAFQPELVLDLLGPAVADHVELALGDGLPLRFSYSLPNGRATVVIAQLFEET